MAVFDRAAARSAGYSDDEINSYLAQIKASQPAPANPTKYLTPPTSSSQYITPPTPTATSSAATTPAPKVTAPAPNPEQQVKKSLLQGNIKSDNLLSGNDILTGIVNSIAKPFIKTGKTVAGAGYETTRAVDINLNIKKSDNLNAKNDALRVQLKNENDPTKKKQIMDQMKKNSAELDKVSENLSKASAAQDPFVNVNEFDNGIKSKGLTDQAKNSIAIASYAVPFGKAGFVGSKFIAPGAAVGAAQALPDAQTPEDVARGAIYGGITGGVLQGAGKAVGAFSKVGGKVEDLGTSARSGVSKIRVKPSVYGYSKEQTLYSKVSVP